jgi:putative nucleotidyltransferase with HDIG domain
MNDHIRDAVNRTDFLPTFPSIVGEVMSVIEDPKSSVSDLVKRMDPSLVGEVLKVANSAYFGRKNFRRISTVEQAVATIGYSGLSDIVLQTPFLSMFKSEDGHFDRTAFIRHSLTTAALGRAVSLAYELGNASGVYVSGMLHDVGMIVIHEYLADESREIDRLMEDGRLSLLEAEEAVLETNHAVIGALLLERWELPESIIAGVRLHHDREAIGQNEIAYVTWLSNRLAHEVDFEKDMVGFQPFFERQRDLLLAEMPNRYLMNHQMEVFEKAFDHLRDSRVCLPSGAGESDD